MAVWPFTKIVPMAPMLLGWTLALFKHQRTKLWLTLSALLRAVGFALFALNFTFVDFFSDMLLLSSVVIGVILSAYSVKYSAIKYGGLSLVIMLDIFLLSMILVFTSQYLMELIVFWLVTELVGFFLVAYDYIMAGEGAALLAAVKYLLFSMIPADVTLFVLLALSGFRDAFTVPLRELQLTLTNPIALLPALIGFFAKAAVFPLHFWLPDAHSVAPAPASALLSGLMVKMGIYGLYLLRFYLIDKALAAYVMVICGSLTAVYGGLQASLQHDIKRILAYSTTSNTAIMTLALALHLLSGDRVLLEAAVLYAVAHALYKATMFLDSGFVESLTHTRDLRKLGFINSVSPLATAAVLITVLAMLGMPPSTGFLAKVMLFAGISKHVVESWIYLVALAVVAAKVALSIIYNMTYLRSHYGVSAAESPALDRGALGLQYAVFAGSFTSFVPVALLSSLTCAEYVELKLLEELAPPLALSGGLFALVSLLVYGGLRGQSRTGVSHR